MTNMREELMQIISNMTRLELGSQFELGNYENEFLDDKGYIWITLSGHQYRVPTLELIEKLNQLPSFHGNLGDVEAILKSFQTELV